MATVTHPFDDPSHPEMRAHFTQRQRHEMEQEDLVAGRSVAALLVAVVTAGLLLMSATMLFL